jgi:hypothetical protein
MTTKVDPARERSEIDAAFLMACRDWGKALEAWKGDFDALKQRREALDDQLYSACKAYVAAQGKTGMDEDEADRRLEAISETAFRAAEVATQ